jgi:type II secretion system protein N
MTPERKRQLRRIGLNAAFGLIVFLIAFYLSFPFDRVKDMAIAQLSARNLDVEIATAGPTLGLGIAFGDVTVKTRPTDGSKPTRIRIDSIRAGLSPLAALGGKQAFNVEANAWGGEIEVDWQGSKALGEVKVRAEEISMASLPGVKEAINLPLAGMLELKMDVKTPKNRSSEAGGTLSWKCAACVIGDGKEKLKIANNPMLAEGISLPRIRLGDFVGRVVIDKGLARLSGVQAKSPDAEISIEGELRLADPMQMSHLDLYVRFRPSEALLKSADKIQLILQLAESEGKRPDGFYGFRMSGTFMRLSTFQWAKTSPFPAGGAARPPGSAGGPPGRGSTASGFGRPGSNLDRAGDPMKDPNANAPAYETDPQD